MSGPGTEWSGLTSAAAGAVTEEPAAGPRSGVAVIVDFTHGPARVVVARPETPPPRIDVACDPPSGRLVVSLGNLTGSPGLKSRLLAGEDGALRSIPAISAALVWDPRSEELAVATDRTGNLGLYYRQDAGRLVVASSAGLAAALCRQQVEFDVEAAAEILWMGFLLSGHTLFRHVSRVPAASVVRFGRGGREVTTYWKPEFRPTTEGSLGTALEVLRAAVDRCTAAARTAIALSGGIDTRAILALVLNLGRHTDGFTSGMAESSDVRVSRRLSRHLRGEWHNATVASTFLGRFGRWAEATVRDSDGTLGVEHAHLAYLNSLLSGWMDILVDGGGAEAAKRGLLRRASASARNDCGLPRLLLHQFGKPDAAEALLGQTGAKHAAGRLLGLLEEQLAEVAHARAGDTLDAFFLRHMWAGYHGTGVAMQNRHVGCRLPFLENDFLDALMEVPLGHRERSALNFLAVRRYAPELERYPRVWMDVEVPWSNSALLRATPAPLVRLAQRLFQRPAFPIALWMRRELQEEARASVGSFLDRGVFEAGALRSALAREGVPVAGSLGRATRLAWRFELWYRTFCP